MAKIEVFTGPMKSGKSAALINKIKRFKISGKNILLIKPKKDTRDGDKIISRNGESYSDKKNIYQLDNINEFEEAYSSYSKFIHPEIIDLVCFDEFHFFDIEDNFIIKLISLHSAGIDVAIAGLDISHNGRPFMSMAKVMCVADYVFKFTAICSSSKEDNATMTRMSINTDDDRVVGGDDIYDPVCKEVWFEDFLEKISKSKEQ